MRLLPCGDLAVLVELDDEQTRRGYDAALVAQPLPYVVEHVPGARTVLVRVEAAEHLPEVVRRLQDVVPLPAASEADVGEPVTIEVAYGGPDLPEVATHLGCSAQEVVARHTGQVWTCEFAGFAPGFGYLAGEYGDLEVPRRATPRTRIPVGSVGLAGPYSGVYPRTSPGGWQIIGTTTADLWDVDRDPPALLAPGRQVRFAEVSR